jgi:hypothetical protein
MPVNAAGQNSERFRSRDSAIALPPFRLKLCARRTEQIAGPQIVGVAVNEGEPASQSCAVRSH